MQRTASPSPAPAPPPEGGSDPFVAASIDPWSTDMCAPVPPHVVRSLRRRLGLTIAGFSHWFGIDPKTVVTWEASRDPLHIRPVDLRWWLRIHVLAIAMKGEEMVEEIRACLEADEELQERGVKSRRPVAEGKRTILLAVLDEW